MATTNPPMPTTPEGKTADDLMRAAKSVLANTLDYFDKKLTRRVARATGEVEEWPEDERPTLTSMPDIGEASGHH